MPRRISKVFIVTGMMGLAFAGSAVSAHAGTLTVRTPSLIAPPGGYVYCKVVATSRRAIGIVATIVDGERRNVTEFGTSYRISPAVTGDGRFYAEETAGSRDESARSCTAKVTDARARDVEVSFSAFDANGNRVATVQGR